MFKFCAHIAGTRGRKHFLHERMLFDTADQSYLISEKDQDFWLAASGVAIGQ